MKVTLNNNRYEAVGEKEERFAPKEAGFWWDNDKKVWYTTSATTAQRLAHYADPETQKVIQANLSKEKPQVIYSTLESLFYFKGGYEYKDVPKAAGFRWSPDKKVWYTNDVSNARKLVQYATPEALQAISQKVAVVDASLSLSRATNANYDIPVPAGLQYLGYQKAGIQYATEREATLIADEMGCIDGDALIHINRGGNGKKIKLSDAYRRFHGLDKVNYNWDRSIPTYARSLCGDQLRLHTVKNILYKGLKSVVELKLKSGKVLICTPDHEIKTNTGWCEAGKLNPGDIVLTNGTPVCPTCGTTENIITYKYAKFVGYCKVCVNRKHRVNGNFKTGKFKDNDGYIRVSGNHDHPRHMGGAVYEHILVMEKHLGRFVVWPEQIHHINENKSDNRIENLKLTTASEHHREHGKHMNMNGGVSAKGGEVCFTPKQDIVVSVRALNNPREVYDIVMDDPHRNFVANGIIVHNCGKTVQFIGILNNMQQYNKVLLICPASLKLNWVREMTKWLVHDKSIAIADTKKSFPDTNIVIINFDILKNFKADIDAVEWDVLGVDECHLTKSGSKTIRGTMIYGTDPRKVTDPAKVKAPIKAKKKVFLTGTPFPNRVKEVFPIINYLDGATWNNFFTFAKKYCNAKQTRFGWDFDGSSNLDSLQEALRSTIMVRRLKKDVLKELPGIIRQVIEIPADGSFVKHIEKEQKAWTKFKEKASKLKADVLLAQVNGTQEDYLNAVSKLNAETTADFTELSALRKETALKKVPFVVDHVTDVLADNDKKVVVFAHHREVVAALEAAFPGISVSLTGETSMQARQDAVDKFQTDSTCRVFIGSIKAAGVGLTLTASSHVVFAELDWVPAAVSQAEARCDRIGQENKVLVQHLVIDGSIDARMAHTLVAKQAIMDAALDTEHAKKDIDEVAYNEVSLTPVYLDDEQVQMDRSVRLEREARKESQKVEREESYIQTKLSKYDFDKLEDDSQIINPEWIPVVHETMRDLAARCDGAVKQDGAGFNKGDSYAGVAFARLPHLNQKQAYVCREMIRFYHGQVSPSVLELLGLM